MPTPISPRFLPIIPKVYNTHKMITLTSEKREKFVGWTKRRREGGEIKYRRRLLKMAINARLSLL
jgi:hypothetical protein